MCIFAPRFIFIVLTTWLTPYRFYASASSLFISEEINLARMTSNRFQSAWIVCTLNAAIVIAHTIDSRVTSPTGQFQTGRIWIMISFYSLTAVKKLGTLRVIGLYTSIAFVLASLSLLSSPLPSDPRKTNHNFCYCLALRACISPHSVRTARLREDSQRVFHRPPGYRFRYFATLDGISRPPFCITTDSFAG